MRIKPNLPALGPRYGKALPLIRQALAALDVDATVANLKTDGRVSLVLSDGSRVELSEGDLLIESTDMPGYRVERAGERAVALATEVDGALREEGLVREIVHAVQLSRKNADLRIEDTISLRLALPDELRELAERFAAFIRSETLASELSLDGGTGDYTETARIDGFEVGIGVSRTGTIFSETYG